MFKALLKRFLGQQWALCSREGGVYVSRYYPLFVPPTMLGKDMTIRSRLPNVCVHNYMGTPPSESWHDHGRAAVSIILKGGYVEEVEGRGRVVRRPGSVSFHPWNRMHRLVETSPNTWTLFLVGWKRRPYEMIIDGKLMNPIEMDRRGQKQPTVLRKVTPEFIHQMNRRRRAYAKLKAKNA